MLGLITRRRHERELAAAKAEATRQRDRADRLEKQADTAVFNRRQIARQLIDADAANRRLAGRNVELGRRLSKLTDTDPEYAAQLERRIGRLQAAGKRILAAWWAEKRRADRLQARLDDAVGLSTSGVQDSSRWQPGYQAPKPEVAS